MPAPGQRRHSPVPGMYTRAELEADLNISPAELDTLERQHIIVASERRRRGDTRPVLFSAADVALARFVNSARRFGMRGEQLRVVATQLSTKRRRLVPGWSGWVAVDVDGDVTLLDADQRVDDVIRGDPRPLLAVPLSVPVMAADDAPEGRAGEGREEQLVS